MGIADILQEQIDYYRARAAEYDEWWFRGGRYDRGAEQNARWHADTAAVDAALVDWLEKHRPRNILELACGTGLFTRHLAPRTDHVTAIDASSEVLAINRARVGGDNVEYIEADLFTWLPRRRYDAVFFSFWLSHVPADRFDAFWAMVARANEGSLMANESTLRNRCRRRTATAARGPHPWCVPRRARAAACPTRSRAPRAASRRARAAPATARG